MAVFTDYCTDLLPNDLAGSSLLQQAQKGKVTFNLFFLVSISKMQP